MTKIEHAFYSAICKHEVPSAQCGCGVVHFNKTTADYNRMKEAEKEHPDKMQEHSEPIMAGDFDGTAFVTGCRCQGALNVANFLWANRHNIAAFLKSFSEAVKTDAEAVLTTLPDPGPGGN